MESKVLNTIERLIKRDLENDWESELEKLNIWDDVSDLYFLFNEDTRKANTIFAFIVLAYDKLSNRIEISMDRMENKIKILRSLGGENIMVDLDYNKAAVGTLDPYNKVIDWYIKRQTDRRWSDILSYLDYHSRAQAIAAMATNSREMEVSGKMLKTAGELRALADSLADELRKENVRIDSALKKEDRTSLTDTTPTDYMSHEVYAKGLLQNEEDNSMEKTANFLDEYDPEDDA